MSLRAPFRYDYVGSFLRPQELIDARVEFDEGKISREQLTEIEDRSITELIEKQKKAGYHVITDGEF
ncbi:MAG TPA: 5-methyltetrahydropteroyltriglutamate--homocysteine methyltransferase, partial [Lachnospiraceae bacterium]|nr:5-methyltetrahydropteroyltriglutamate--homocysteine methyltransferase [Lachnospiraceae bacterium]